MTHSHSRILSQGDHEVIVVFMYTTGKYSHSLHKISTSDLYLSSGRHKHRRDKPKILPKPLLKLPYKLYPGFMGFVSLGSKIYMFGGEKYYPGKQPKLCNSCYVIDTCNKPYEINDALFPMKKPKCEPIVLGPLDERFYVLSSNLAFRDLEEFDPETEVWTALSLPPIDSDRLNKDERPDYEVLSYATNGNLLLLSTPKGIYTFDVKKKENQWEYQSSLGNDKMFPFIQGAKLLDDFWYAFPQSIRSPLQSYHFDMDKGFNCYGEVRGVRRPSKLVKRETTNIMVPLGARKLCVLRSGLREHGIHVYVTVDICKLTERRVGSNGKLRCPKVSTQYSTSYVKKDDWLTPLTATCLVVKRNKTERITETEKTM